MAVSAQAVLDALPYVDNEFEDPELRESAMRCIEEETKRYRPTKNYLEYLPTPKITFESPLLRLEMERLSARQPMEVLSMKRYELPQPSAAQKNDISAWRDSVNNSMAQLEHQSGRIINLELLSQYGSNEWKIHNEELSRLVEQETSLLKALKSQVQEVNWERKTEQTTVGAQLSSLGSHWNALVHKNFEIERVCLELQREIAVLKQHALERGIAIKD